MGVTVANIIAGPMDVLEAPVGSPEPDETDDLESFEFDPAWRDCGGTNGGAGIVIAQEFGSVEADQTVDVIASLPNKRRVDVELSLLETTLENLKMANNGGELITGANTDRLELIANTVTTPPTYRMLALRGTSAVNGKRAILLLRRVLVTSDVSWKHQKDAATMLGVTYTSHYVSSTVGPATFLQSH